MTKQELKEIRFKLLKVDIPCSNEGCDQCANCEECENVRLAVECINRLILIKNKGE